MEHPTELMEVSEVRGIVARFVRDEPATYGDLQVAKDTIETMRQEAAEYGLTAADVVRAILGPVFEKKRGCDCPTCKGRRSEVDGEKSKQMSTSAGRLPTSRRRPGSQGDHSVAWCFRWSYPPVAG